MIYVDALTGCLAHNNWNYTRFCHLMADCELELIEFAVLIGCKREWLQHSRAGVPVPSLGWLMAEASWGPGRSRLAGGRDTASHSP